VSYRDAQSQPELVQPVVVDPDVVRELVHDGDADLLDEVVDVLGEQAQRDPVEADPVGSAPA
jgi:hypothetical protein